MKMTPKQISAAYRAVQELSNVILPYKTARSLTALNKRLTEEQNIVVDMEEKLVAEYGGELQGGGACNFRDTDTAQRFQAALDAAREQEDEIQLPMVDLSKYTNLIRISPAAIEALEGIVIFEPPEEGNANG